MYMHKCMALLNDKDIYKEYRDQTESIHSKVVKQLLDLKDSTGHKFMVITRLLQDSISSEKYMKPAFH